MKKISVFLLISIIAFSVISCSSGNKPAEGNTSVGDLISSIDSSEKDQSGGDDITDMKISVEDVKNHAITDEESIYCMEDENGDCEFLEYEGDDAIVVIPDSYRGMKITSVAHYVFGSGSAVQGLSFPDSLLEVADFTCGTNENLQVVIFGANINRIGESAFINCQCLHTVVLNDSLQSISTFAFANCSSLESIEIPESVSNIEDTAFYGHSDGFTIIGKPGSYAEQFAESNGIKFKSN